MPARLHRAAALLALVCSSASAGPAPAGPSFDCSKVRPDSIAALVCADPQLSALDRKLTAVYAAAAKQAAYEPPPMLRAEQRGWVNTYPPTTAAAAHSDAPLSIRNAAESDSRPCQKLRSRSVTMA